MTLTVESGVSVQFETGNMNVYGTLSANGATFTSNAATPAVGDWGSIVVYSGGSATIANGTVRYGSTLLVARGGSTLDVSGTTVSQGNTGLLLVEGGTASLSNTTLSDLSAFGVVARDSTGYAIASNQGNPNLWSTGSLSLQDVSITGNNGLMRLHGAVPITYSGTNQLTGNTGDYFFVEAPGHTGNWELAPHGGVATYFFSNSSRKYRAYETGGVYLSTGSGSMSIQPGTVIKFSRGFVANFGAVTAVGTPLDPIVFTAFSDDSAGGDTNSDGTASTPSPGYWDLVGTAGSSTFEHVQVRYAERGLHTNGDVSVSNSLFEENHVGLSLRFAGRFDSTSETWVPTPSTVDIRNNTFGRHQTVPITSAVNVQGVVEDNSFGDGSGFHGIGFRYDGAGIESGGVTYTRRDTLYDLRTSYVILASSGYTGTRVGDGATLVIEPGVVLKGSGLGVEVDVGGELVVDGTAADPVVFTSTKDDSYGYPNDTNNDGNTTVPNTYDWRGIAYEPGTSGFVDHAVVQFASRGSYRYGNPSQTYTGGAITMAAASIPVTNTELRNVRVGLSLIGDVTPDVSDNVFSNTEQAPVALSFAANPTFSGNTMENASVAALGILGEELRFGGTLRTRDFAGYTNITYVLLGDVTIAGAVDVTVEPGVVIKGNRNGIFVDGGLKLEGTPTDPIVFTSISDDRYGTPQDTNGDGNATEASAADWETIQYRSSSRLPFSTVSNVEVHFADIGLALSGTDVPVTDALLSNTSWTGLAIDGAAAPTISNVTIRNTPGGRAPIVMSVLADPTFTDIAFVSVGGYGLGIVEAYSRSGIAGQVLGGTTLTQDATLEPRSYAGFANVPYDWSSRMTIGQGAKLTIAKNTILKMRSHSNVEGALAVEGTDAEPVIFTDYADDSAGGDTNADGNNSSPSRGGWGIHFRASDRDDENVIRHARFSYGGYYSTLLFQDAGGLVENVVIEQTNDPGVQIEGLSDPTIRRTQFLNVDNVPVSMSPLAPATFEGNTLLNVGVQAIELLPERFNQDATIPQRSFAGYDNITYSIVRGDYSGRGFSVAPGAVLTIPAGTVFKSGRSRPSVWIDVEGALVTQGTSERPVIFTHAADDRFGNPLDTFGDGTGTTPEQNAAGTFIRLANESDDATTLIEGVHMAYGATGIEMTSAAPTIRNNRFEALRLGLNLQEVSNPTIMDNVFDNLGRPNYSQYEGLPIELSLVSDFTASGNVLAGTTWEAIGVRNETLVQDVTLPRRTFAGREGIPYLMNAYTVGNNATLTIAPGNVIKSNSSSGLTVRRGLIAKGGTTPDSLIVFTSTYDDFYGGDTNRDSTATGPAVGDWGGIVFEDEALAPLSIIDNVVVRYAGYIYSTKAAITANSASPTITNSVIAQNRIGVLATGSANPVVTGNDLYDNVDFGVQNTGTFTIDATNNWWGADTGPSHASNPDGTGDTVSDNVTFDPFVGGTASRPILGDASGNGSVSSFDASKILRHVAGNETLGTAALAVSDVSGNGSVTAMDASYVLQYVVGLIAALPEETQKNSTPRLTPAPSAAVLDVGRLESEAGVLVRVPVHVSQVKTLMGLNATLTYDPEMLELTGVESGALADGRSFDWGSDAESGTVRLAVAGTETPAGNDVLATLVFRVAADVRGTVTTPLTVTKVTANETDRTKQARAGQLVVEGLPTAFEVGGNYPNSVRSITTIPVALPEAATVRIEVFNVLGQQVATLVDRQLEAGRHDIQWTADRSTLGSGIYFFRVQAGTQTATGRMTLVR